MVGVGLGGMVLYTHGNFTIIEVVPPFLQKLWQETGKRHTTLNSMEAIEFNVWGRRTGMKSAREGRAKV